MRPWLVIVIPIVVVVIGVSIFVWAIALQPPYIYLDSRVTSYHVRVIAWPDFYIKNLTDSHSKVIDTFMPIDDNQLSSSAALKDLLAQAIVNANQNRKPYSAGDTGTASQTMNADELKQMIYAVGGLSKFQFYKPSLNEGTNLIYNRTYFSIAIYPPFE
ncbi:MAG: hypothetical protein ABI361_11935 [Nitrososphaera sp.]|jgi:hypothetical protein